MTGKAGLTVEQVKERYPDTMRLLEQVGLDNGLEVNPGYRFRQGGIADEFAKAEQFAATIDWDDVDVVEAILTVDCDHYDALVMSSESGQAADQLIASLFDGKEGVDESGLAFFQPCYARRLRTSS
jgi:hypothetical protein